MDILDLSKQKAHSNGYFPVKPLGVVHEFYLTGYIEEADNYLEWFDAIRHAGEHDLIKIYINSYGGDLFTAIQFMRVMADTNATVICSVEGACMSAATMVFMCAHQFEVTPHSVFMFHNYSGGAIGKGGEMIDQLLHERKWSERMMREIYSEFMSETEIKAMLDNKDMWMDGEEVVVRMNKRLEVMKNKLEKTELVEAEPKAPRAKKLPVKKVVTKKSSVQK
jgi:ATP-dependent protease ClpP protease subunit